MLVLYKRFTQHRAHTDMTDLGDDKQQQPNKRQRTTNAVASLMQVAAASAGVPVPEASAVDRLSADALGRMLGMLTLQEGVVLRAVSKEPGNRFVLPKTRSPELKGARMSAKQVTGALTSVKAQQVLQQSLWLTTDLTLDGRHHPLTLLARLRFRHLKTLNVWQFNDDDLTPLAALPNLETLNLQSFQGKDLRPLASLTKLQELYLNMVREADLRPLATLVSLKRLDMPFFEEGDLTPLSYLVQLQTLNLSAYEYGSLSPLSTLTQLQELNLSHYAYGELAPLAKMTKLQRVYLSSYTPTEEVKAFLRSALKRTYISWPRPV